MRDFDKVLTLIKSSALLFQYQNDRDEKGNIIASLEDYELVYSLRSLITQSVSPVPTHIIEFLEMAKDLSSNGNEVTRADLQTELKKSTSTIKRYISFAQHEDLIEVEGKGKKQRIKVIEIPKETSPLPEPKKLASYVNQ